VEMDEDEPLQHPTNDSVTEDNEDPTNIQTVSAEKSIIWFSPEIPKSGLDTTSIEVRCSILQVEQAKVGKQKLH
jgi:hypothetical protein